MNKPIIRRASLHFQHICRRLMRSLASLSLYTLFIYLFASCSITSHLPEGEVLYTGVSHIDQQKVDTLDDEIATVIATNLEVLPNSAFLGSAYRMSPFPVGLWVFNGLYPTKEKGFRRWIWTHFKSDPVKMSDVNPKVRAQAAELALRDEGYFDAQVTYDTVFSAKDSLQAKVSYSIDYQHHSRLGDITFLKSPYPRVDSIVQHTLDQTLLHTGDRFSASKLEAEAARITAALQDSGYFFFKDSYIKFLGDTTRQALTVDLRILLMPNGDVKAMAPCTIDSVHFKLDYGAGLDSKFSDTLRFMTVGYNGKQLVKTRTLRSTLGFRHHALYTPDRISLCKTLISRLNTFKLTTTELQVIHLAGDSLTPMISASPRTSRSESSRRHGHTSRTSHLNTLTSSPDTLTSHLSPLTSNLSPLTSHPDTLTSSPLTFEQDTTNLRLLIHATYNYPWTGTTEIGCVYKDNQQVGPGVTLSALRRNLWGGGEKLSFEFDGSYEWRTGNQSADQGSLINSYELGAKVSLSAPRLQIPRFFRPNREAPVSSTYSLSIDWMRRAGLFEMVRAGGSVEYGFGLSKTSTFTVTPIKLTYVSLVRKTDNFLSIVDRYPSLNHSFENQFIPQLQFSWTYDNSSVRSLVDKKNYQYFNITLAEAGGLCDVLMGQWGTHRKQGERQLFFQPFSQFLKATAELRNTQRISNKLTFASRLMGGIGYAYGNSDVMPYSEQFFIGGPNSLRGFSVRGVGPGSSLGYQGGKYDYLNRVGDIKLEANAELRFPVAGSLYGALFVDAGNVWTMRQQEVEKTTLSADFLTQLALDTGLGFRLDMGMLVLRFDIGVPLHDPNTDESHYFNCRQSWLSNLGYNLAVGYPF